MEEIEFPELIEPLKASLDGWSLSGFVALLEYIRVCFFSAKFALLIHINGINEYLPEPGVTKLRINLLGLFVIVDFSGSGSHYHVNLSLLTSIRFIKSHLT